MFKVGTFKNNPAEAVEETQEISQEARLMQDLIKSNRKLARLAFYGISFSIFVALFFSWLASYYALALDTRISEQQSDILLQMDQKISQATTGPAKDNKPKFVDLQVPTSAASKGNPDAKVSIVEFADFQCPFCDIFFREVETQLVAKYVDTGLAKLTYMDFAFLGQESKDAANAAKCAQEQGKFWEYHDKLYSSQKGENQGAFSKKNLLSFGRALGLEMASFTSCVQGDAYAQQVEDETLAGRRAGVTGTPTVFINGKMIVGAQDYTVFDATVEQALNP